MSFGNADFVMPSNSSGRTKCATPVPAKANPASDGDFELFSCGTYRSSLVRRSDSRSTGNSEASLMAVSVDDGRSSVGSPAGLK